MKRYLSDVQKQIERLPRRWRGSLLAAVLACLVIFALEVLVESVLESEEEPGRSPLARSIFELSGVYQRAVTVGWRKPEPRFTVIVELNVDNDAGLRAVTVNNVCAQRLFLADLIRTLTAAGPAVIVVDKYFGRDTCVGHPAGTDALRKAVENARAAKVPIVVGLNALQGPGAAHAGGRIHIEPSLFGEGSSVVDQAILNIDHDSRRMALRWCGVVDSEGLTQPDWCETLALKAARMYDRQIIVKYPRLETLLQQSRHPYISFMRPEQFCRYAVLADGRLAKRSDRRCPVNPDGTVRVEYIRGRVVVFGETSRHIDIHTSVVGPVSGVFKAVPVLDYLFGIATFLSVTLIGAKLHGRPLLAILLITLTVTSVIGIVVGLILLGGLYVNPVGVSVLALLFDGSHLALSWVLGKAGRHAAARGAG